jgi:hypothetical protein
MIAEISFTEKASADLASWGFFLPVSLYRQNAFTKQSRTELILKIKRLASTISAGAAV